MPDTGAQPGYMRSDTHLDNPTAWQAAHPDQRAPTASLPLCLPLWQACPIIRICVTSRIRSKGLSVGRIDGTARLSSEIRVAGGPVMPEDG